MDFLSVENEEKTNGLFNNTIMFSNKNVYIQQWEKFQ